MNKNFYNTTKGIEISVIKYLDYLKHIIVPNLHWGMFRYELDICALDTRSMFAKEIEIKISKADLKRDLKKSHQHKNPMIKYLWFAMPESMINDIEFVPERAGILLVSINGYTQIQRKAVANPLAKKWTMEQAMKLGRLGTIRYWSIVEGQRQKEKYEENK